MTYSVTGSSRRGLGGAFAIVLLGVTASHAFAWARGAFNLVGGDPQTAWGNAFLWFVTPVFLASCAVIGGSVAGDMKLGQVWIAIVAGLALEWLLEVLLSWWPQLLRSDRIFAAVPVLIGGLGSMAAGDLFRERSVLAGAVSLALSTAVAFGAAWVLLFFE